MKIYFQCSVRLLNPTVCVRLPKGVNLCVFPVGANLGCVTEEGSSAAEVKHEIHTSPSQPVSFTSSPKELNDTLHMDPSDIKLDPSADTPAPGTLGCGVVVVDFLFLYLPA